MLTGPELGKAVAEAIRLKGVSKAAVARHFGIKGPSIYDWIDHGRVGKQHLMELVAYFSDVVPPSHWGLSLPDNAIPSAKSQLERLDASIIRAAIILAKGALKLGADEELVIERDPETFAQALRTAIAARQRREADGNAGPGSGDGEAGGAGGAPGAPEDREAAQSAAGRRRKRA